jgi:hypothetical protein
MIEQWQSRPWLPAHCGQCHDGSGAVVIGMRKPTGADLIVLAFAVVVFAYILFATFTQ